MLDNPLPLPVILNDTLLASLGVPLDGTPTQRQTVMQLVEAMVMSYLGALLVDSNSLTPPVYITERHTIYFNPSNGRYGFRVSWGPITSVQSVDLLAEDETTVLVSLASGEYYVSEGVKVFLKGALYPASRLVRVTYTAGHADAASNPNLITALKVLFELYSSSLISNRGMNAEEQIQSLNNKAYSVAVKPVTSTYFGQHSSAALARRLLDTSGLRIVRDLYAIWI